LRNEELATKFKGKIRRAIRLWDIPTPVIVTLTEDGVEMSVPGSRTHVSASWEVVAKAMQTSSNVPSIYFGQPIKLLQQQAQKALAKKSAS
jgi:capsid protein